MNIIREVNDNKRITNAKDCLKYLDEFKNQDREHFIVLGLDSQNKVLYREICSIGILNACIIHAREVFKKAIMSSANAIIIAHNHPSGDLEPSSEDIKINSELKKASMILHIPILDNLIISSKGYYSFIEKRQNVVFGGKNEN